MTEQEKHAIRASFAGKRVSQMTALERKVFDEDFQYGVATRGSLVLSRLRSGLPTHLCGLSLKCQGAFAA